MKFTHIALATALSFSVLPGTEQKTQPITINQASHGSTFTKGEITAQVQIEAARGVLERTVPGISQNFILEIIPQENDRDVYEIEQLGEKIALRGSTGVAICSAFNRYLMDFLKCDVSWCGDQLNIPSELPKVETKIRVRTPSKYRAYMNYCTFSYSAPWWDWKRWQQEVDFMALKGINMPLAAVGLDAVWYNTLLKFNFTDQEARDFLVAPGHQAWQWMTNIESFGGPLPKSWIKGHIELGQKMLRQQYDLGMMPIQQSFSGYIPRLMKEKFPKSSILEKHGWCGFEGTAELDPMDPLFEEFGKAFLKENIRLFGAGQHYAADPFHESSPPRKDKEYLSSVAHKILGVMKAVDPEAKWVMQGWTPHEGVATAVPKGELIMLDLVGGRHSGKKNFWGHEILVGALHNFGGRINMHGDLADNSRNRMVNAKKKAPNVIGMGLFMEGIVHNPVFFNNQLDMIWRDGEVDVNQWLKDYAERRYGAKSANAEKAWDILLKTVYSRATSGVESSSIIAARPALDCRKSGPNAGFGMRYKAEDLIPALEALLADSDKFENSSGYRFDVMDLCRQVLTNLGQELHNEVRMAYDAKDKAAFQQASDRFLNLLLDVDRLLATRDEYSFHKWIRDARSWATNDAERKLYEKNASMLLTHWGPENTPAIFDYAWREWSGLIGSYYHGRWEVFHNYLAQTLEDEIKYNDTLPGMKGRQPLNATPILEKITQWETNWINSDKQVLAAPQGDTIAIAQELYKKYLVDTKRVYSAPHQAKVQAFKIKHEDKSNGKKIGFVDYAKNQGIDTIDLTNELSGEGRYRFQFNSQRGGVIINKIEVLLNDSPIWTDKRRRGGMRKPEFSEIVEFELEEYAFGSPYTLRLSFDKMSHIIPKVDVRLKSLGHAASQPEKTIEAISYPIDNEDPSIVGKWEVGKLNARIQTELAFDVSRIIKEPGTYLLSFKFEKGRHKLTMDEARIMSADQELALDKHKGETGNKHIDNTYTLKINETPKEKTILRVLIQPEGGNNTQGTLRLIKIDNKINI
ncbi:alpha-N-acetylglucosaminidase [Lentisphaera profundi]|uniref:Alpha-N-acetylglucosaminidase n=1 Tax=Lentisphaera profundi TaxID=1658616 RepID=A0ABY7VQT1_9BACT|nr:alpha-N-acetylglucosaminidase [Lentisphaera profundi]WDE96558.1 alpha-N-acetylglucosaminidase [Lentisphaera profundi]